MSSAKMAAILSRGDELNDIDQADGRLKIRPYGDSEPGNLTLHIHIAFEF